MIHEVGISLYPSRKNWMTEAFEHFSSGFIFLEFTEAFRHRFQHGCFPIPNSIFDRRRGTTPWLCSSGRWSWMLWTNIQKPIGLSEDWIYPKGCHQTMAKMRLWSSNIWFSGTKPRFWMILTCGLQVFVSNIVFPGPARLFRVVLPALPALASRRRTPDLRRDICLNFSHLPETARWVCLKIGCIPNYSHLIGIMIINHWL